MRVYHNLLLGLFLLAWVRAVIWLELNLEFLRNLIDSQVRVNEAFLKILQKMDQSKGASCAAQFLIPFSSQNEFQKINYICHEALPMQHWSYFRNLSKITILVICDVSSGLQFRLIWSSEKIISFFVNLDGLWISQMSHIFVNMKNMVNI